MSDAERAHQNGFRALVVLGGDKHVGQPRSVEHAWQLREKSRRGPALALGGWVESSRRSRYAGRSPPRRARDRGVLPDPDRLAPQRAKRREAFSRKGDAAVSRSRALFGLFYYRSANPRTLDVLSSFLPVPVDELKKEFADGRHSGISLRALIARSCRRPVRGTSTSAICRSDAPPATLRRIIELGEELTPDPLSLKVPGVTHGEGAGHLRGGCRRLTMKVLVGLTLRVQGTDAQGAGRLSLTVQALTRRVQSDLRCELPSRCAEGAGAPTPGVRECGAAAAESGDG